MGKNTNLTTFFAILFIVVAILIAIQTTAIYYHTEHVKAVSEEFAAQQEQNLSEEKSRQEVIGLRLKNEKQQLFWGNLMTTFGPLATTIVALLGALLGLRNYLDTREKERLENASGELKDILTQAADESERLRIVGVVGLQHFFTRDKKEYHLRALSSLVAMARLEQDEEVLNNIGIAAEQAVKQLDLTILQQVSWRNVVLKNVDFSGQTLRGVDFRDAILEDADFSGCDLINSCFVNSRLNGACFDNANLQRADLTYADLAGTSFINADLSSAILEHTKVLRMNLRNANLKSCVFDSEKIPWPLIAGWREAQFNSGILDQLITVHGPAPSGKRIAMLMWEIPPLVAGGTWTAAYHLVRNLQKRGVRLSIIVPWSEALILPNPFGCDVELIPLGITPPDLASSPYGVVQPSWSPYSYAGLNVGPMYSSYGYSNQSYSGYSSPYYGTPSYNPYSYSTSQQFYSPYGSNQFSGPYGRGQSTAKIPSRGTGILRVAEEFRRRFLRMARSQDFDIIHAHDWVTFGAAQTAAMKLNIPWVAHFHSTEFERRSQHIDNAIARIEQDACIQADAIATPSNITAAIIADRYRTAAEKIIAIPNTLSLEGSSEIHLGRFESQRIVFTGRLTLQKGPDLFIDIFRQLQQRQPDCRACIFGTGELEQQLPTYLPGLQCKGGLEWQERGRAFDDASAVIVPSRAEPFGMVILEAMQHSVPVFFTNKAGANDVINAGITIDPENPEATADVINRYLNDWDQWEQIVEQQTKAIDAYIAEAHENKLIDLWERLQFTQKSLTS